MHIPVFLALIHLMLRVATLYLRNRVEPKKMHMLDLFASAILNKNIFFFYQHFQ